MKPIRKNICKPVIIFYLLAITFIAPFWLSAQPPSHDPSTMLQNVDGRYWIFTTGNGIWAMSSNNSEFTNWRAETTPFSPGTWPEWVKNYVANFKGHFWAPDVIKIGDTYYLYYSCAGDGAPAAIGLTTAKNLSGPWSDQGMVYAGNNAIDPALHYDGKELWMTWGNWVEGIDICQLDPLTGKRINSIKTKLVSGQVEGPALLKNGNYYYLFYQRGLCCNGLNSTYRIVVARSTKITGPYTGERSFIPNKTGRFVGPGHVGYNYDKLTFHFYDGTDNGNAKMMVSTLSWVNDWPVAELNLSEKVVPDKNYQITARHTEKTLNANNCGTVAGTNVDQWDWLNTSCQTWQMNGIADNVFRISPLNAPQLALDVTNCSNANNTNIRLWDWLGNDCQKWKLVDMTGNYFQLKNIATNKCLSILGTSFSNGTNAVLSDCNTFAHNLQFMFNVATNTSAIQTDKYQARVFPNPSNGKITVELDPNNVNTDMNIKITDMQGRTVYQLHQRQTTTTIQANTGLKPGCYLLFLKSGKKSQITKLLID
jgi:arabinan endo-1,5-alpha-L-arabinosidase